VDDEEERGGERRGTTPRPCIGFPTMLVCVCLYILIFRQRACGVLPTMMACCECLMACCQHYRRVADTGPEVREALPYVWQGVG